MIYFCADDYGMSAEGNGRIENCLENGALNKVSVLPNGETADFWQRLSKKDKTVSLHINLIEGRPLSDREDVSLLITESGYFKYSFAGLFLLSFTAKRKELEKQLYREIKSQIEFFRKSIGENTPLFIDSHQHTHMIPLLFRTLMRVIEYEGIDVEYLRIPAEPVSPYIFTPSLYFEYSLKGFIKQWVLKTLAFVNRRAIKKSGIPCAYFMGVMFSGNMNGKRVKKLLARYMKLAEKNNKDIEIGFHPGYMESGEELILGSRKDFREFYFSPRRKIEYDTLLSLNK